MAIMGRTKKYKYPFFLFYYDHEGDYFICNICGMRIDNRHERTAHLKKYHPEIFNKYKKMIEENYK